MSVWYWAVYLLTYSFSLISDLNNPLPPPYPSTSMTYPGHPPTYPAVPNASYYPPPPTIAPTPQPPTVIVEVRNVQKYFLSLRNVPSTSSCLYTCLNDYGLCRDLILRRRGIRSFPFKSDRTKRTKINKALSTNCLL